jgi:hypothetical protein
MSDNSNVVFVPPAASDNLNHSPVKEQVKIEEG